MIEVNNLTTNLVDEAFLKKVAEKVLKSEKKEANLSIALIGQGRMREINKKYRRKNRVTDVLSFSTNQKIKLVTPSDKKLGLGEVVICLREVKKNAKRFNSTFKTELARVLIHGILHLLGYNHEISKEKAKKMEEKQNYYIELCQSLIL